MAHYLAFAGVALGMVLTPGPNMIYLLSHSVTQGRGAGLISLCGVALGFLFYMLAAALGVSALLLTIPLAYETLKCAGALYLFYLAYQAFQSARKGGLALSHLEHDSPRKLFMMGFLTNVLNPKIALLYLALLPQFLDPASARPMLNAFALGFIQIGVSLSVNAGIILAAGQVALFLKKRPFWAKAQGYVMGAVLSAVGLRLLIQQK